MSAPDLSARLASVLDAQELGALAQLELPGSRAPLPLATPRTLEQAGELLKLAARDGLCVLPLGFGSKLGWYAPATRVDFALSTRALRGLRSYEPEDGTLSALAGTSAAEIAVRVAAGGHAFSPDVSCPGAATIGGLVAAGCSGFDRLLAGPLRHLVLGTRAIDGSGRVLKSGGQLVKNVTGYDLHRLHAGSGGALCLLVEVSLRLLPLPELEIALRVRFPSPDLQPALSAARTLLALPARWRSVLVRRAPGENAELCVCVGGKAEVARAEREAALLALSAARAPEAECSEGDAAHAQRCAWRDEEQAGGRWPELVLSGLPTRALPATERVQAALRARGFDPLLRVHPGLASASWHIAPLDRAAPLTAAQARELAQEFAELGRRRPGEAPLVLQWRDAPLETRTELELHGAAPPGAELMRRIQQQLDPRGVFARGRMPGGL
jgi:glycolate oxidase FAD binding subunit